MTTFPASAACGRSPRAWSGTVTTTTSPARAASSAVAACVRPELVDEVGERLRATTVAQHDVVAGVDRQSRDGAADVAASDEAPGGHAGANAVGCRSHSPAPGVRPD